jgi:peptidase M23-like protein
MKTCALFVALFLAAPVFPQTKIDFLQEGRDYTNLFYAGKAKDIWANLSPSMKKVFGEEDAILGLQLQTKGQIGAETEVVEEHVLLQEDFVVYERIVMFQKITTPEIVQWTFDREGVVTGFFIRSAVGGETHFLDYVDKVALRLPFKGNWLVLSGGRSVAENRHAETVDQRFAADITAIRHGRTFSGDGTQLEQYFCFGRTILAPGNGTVVGMSDGIPDNPINAPFDSAPAGNFVLIDHGNSEYSLLAHLKLGSIKVKVGDKVQPGEKIGQCGNSGNATVPHLHIHLQNSPVLFKGEGLPLQFQNYIADKKFVSTGEPVTGQIIRDKHQK